MGRSLVDQSMENCACPHVEIDFQAVFPIPAYKSKSKKFKPNSCLLDKALFSCNCIIHIIKKKKKKIKMYIKIQQFNLDLYVNLNSPPILLWNVKSGQFYLNNVFHHTQCFKAALAWWCFFFFFVLKFYSIIQSSYSSSYSRIPLFDMHRQYLCTYLHKWVKKKFFLIDHLCYFLLIQL